MHMLQEQEDNFDKERAVMRSYIIERCSKPVSQFFGAVEVPQVGIYPILAASVPTPRHAAYTYSVRTHNHKAVLVMPFGTAQYTINIAINVDVFS